MFLFVSGLGRRPQAHIYHSVNKSVAPMLAVHMLITQELVLMINPKNATSDQL